MATTHACSACADCLQEQSKEVAWIVRTLANYLTPVQKEAALEQIEARQAGCTALKLSKRRRREKRL